MAPAPEKQNGGGMSAAYEEHMWPLARCCAQFPESHIDGENAVPPSVNLI
jgi:hypothetical protein